MRWHCYRWKPTIAQCEAKPDTLLAGRRHAPDGSIWQILTTARRAAADFHPYPGTSEKNLSPRSPRAMSSREQSRPMFVLSEKKHSDDRGSRCPDADKGGVHRRCRQAFNGFSEQVIYRNEQMTPTNSGAHLDIGADLKAIRGLPACVAASVSLPTLARLNSSPRSRHRPTPNFPPSWNVAPNEPLSVARFDRKAGERSLDMLRWALVPYWATDIKAGLAPSHRSSFSLDALPRPVSRERRPWRSRQLPSGALRHLGHGR
jgi:hypothetical protein